MRATPATSLDVLGRLQAASNFARVNCPHPTLRPIRHMNRIITGCSAAALLAVVASNARAQSAKDFAGFAGLMTTPIGALTPMGPAMSGDTSRYRVQLRYGRWQAVEGDGRANDAGVGVGIRGGRTRTTIEIGYIHSSPCDDCDGLMAGVDMDIPIIESASSDRTGLRLGLNPSAGLMRPTNGSGTALSAALSVPVSAAFKAGTSLLIVPFLSPGLGYGHISDSDFSEGGSRPMMGGGVTIAGTRNSTGVTISAHKVFLRNAPTVYGIGFSFTQQ